MSKLRGERSRDAHGHATTTYIHIRSNELNAEAEVQGEGGLPVCASNRILGKKQPSRAGKLDRAVRLHRPPKEPQHCCPECGSSRLYKDGLGYRSDGSKVQRWLCRDCGLRF
ncbi:hypothetical protein G4O51_13460, partial [Candidatus Bathyarchaeota archaeon A05DMB-2]|nr:hypothetical protein [Candidatus Bathyarchaeota archaeon A05DMB-2]